MLEAARYTLGGIEHDWQIARDLVWPATRQQAERTTRFINSGRQIIVVLRGLKRRVALSLVATGALAVASNVALYSADWVSAEQLSETTGPVLQYVTIAHMVVGHLSYLMDMRAYRGLSGGSPPTGAPSRSGV